MECNWIQTLTLRSSNERNKKAISKLCGKLQQLRHSHLLPPELLLDIVDYFRLPIPDVTSTTPAPEFLVNRKALYNLSIASRLFNALATPLLYQTVIFFIDSRDYEDYLRARTYGGIRSLVLLVRTLLWKDGYCRYIENIICPASLKPHDWATEDTIEQEISLNVQTVLSTLPSQDGLSDRQKFILNSAHLDQSRLRKLPTPYLSTLTLRFLTVLVCLSYNLRLLLRWTENSRYLALDYFLRHAMMQNRYSIIPRLLTLYIQQFDFSRSFSESNIEIATELLEIGKIRQLHIWHNNEFLTLPEGHDTSWIGRIRELKLIACIDAKIIFHIFESAVELENFSLVVTKSRDLHRPLPPADKDLNHALVILADTLKVLELRTCENTWFLDQLGPSKLLNCLPRLEKLETLTTEIPLITRTQTDASVQADASAQTNTSDTRVLGKLPPNLVSLTLVEMWQDIEGGFTRKEDFIMDFSTTFATELLGWWLPSLKRIRYIPGVVESCLGPQQLDAIKKLFDKAHVAFSHEADSLPTRFFYIPT
ncbi:hypothetical protein F4814DRAFT_356825 [Daldinia grandis]|nr:hypothetical protein F4814DRAFT_356825 [Daldinia grandis]